jgi:hypothetical protein
MSKGWPSPTIDFKTVLIPSIILNEDVEIDRPYSYHPKLRDIMPPPTDVWLKAYRENQTS